MNLKHIIEIHNLKIEKVNNECAKVSYWYYPNPILVMSETSTGICPMYLSNYTKIYENKYIKLNIQEGG